MKTAKAYRPDIDGLRAIAVLAVVFYHFEIGPVPGGFVGVDVFFVISGYLITSIIYREMVSGTFSFAAFYERRARRLLPAFFLVAAASLFAGYHLLLPPDYRSLGHQTFYSSIGLANFYFLWNAGYFDRSAELLPMLHMWSLSVEEQFYLLWPPLLLLILGLSRQSRMVVTTSLVIIVVMSLAASVLTVRHDQTTAFFMLHTRAWELALGSLLVFAPLLKTTVMTEISRFLGLFLIIGAVTLLDSQSVFPGLNAVFPVVGAALIIWPSASKSLVSKILSLRPLVFIGLISYSLYLWHWPLAVFGRHWSLDEALTPGVTIYLLPASFLLAILTYFLVEKPFRRRGSVSRRRVFMSSSVSIGVLLLPAMIVAQTGGLPGRLHPHVLSLAEGAVDVSPDRSRCHRGDRSSLEISESCRLGDPSAEPRFAIWADSHGVELATAIGDHIRPYGKSILSVTYSACPPSLGLERKIRPGCRPHNELTLEYFLATPSIEKVFVIAYYGGYSEEEGGQSLAGIHKSVGELREAGKQVIIFTPVPVAPFSVPQRAAKLQVRNPGSDLRLDRGFYNESNGDVISSLRGLGQHPSVQIIEVAEHLCSSADCYLTIDGRSLYFDRHHLSTFGAGRLVSAVARSDKTIFLTRRDIEVSGSLK